MAGEFRHQIASAPKSYFSILLAGIIATHAPPIENALLSRLTSCAPGKPSWVEYQKLVGTALQHLFCPPLDSPISESGDGVAVNRRDWIFPNYADSGFWHFMRQMYRADYIVVDAKNYKGPISKTQVLQIANYLKPHGTGMFAMIATRAGADRGADLTIKEQWAVHAKLILVLKDEHLQSMLLAASSRGDPHKVLGQAIQDFRLSM